METQPFHANLEGPMEILLGLGGTLQAHIASAL